MRLRARHLRAVVDARDAGETGPMRGRITARDLRDAAHLLALGAALVGDFGLEAEL